MKAFFAGIMCALFFISGFVILDSRADCCAQFDVPFNEQLEQERLDTFRLSDELSENPEKLNYPPSLRNYINPCSDR